MTFIFRILVTAGLLSLAVPASAEVVQKSEAGFVVRLTEEVAASPAEAWKTFITPSTWWSAAHTFSGDATGLTLDPVANGCFCERMPLSKDASPGQKPGSVVHLRVIYAEPYRALRMSGGLGPLQSEAVVGTMTVTFKPVEGEGRKGTRVLLEYTVGGYMRYKADAIAVAVDKVLAEQLRGLARVIGPLKPKPAIPEMGAETLPADDDPTVSAGTAKSEAEAGESVKAALDKMFKKKPVLSGQ